MDVSKVIFPLNWDAYNNGMRVIANKGGTRSGKTYTLLILLLKVAMSAREPLLISVVSESFPHLKRGAMRDFGKILEATRMREDVHYQHSRTDHLYTFNGLGKIEFFSADNAGKVHGAQRDILFINECNHIPYEIYRQLAVRTSKAVFIDFNPTSRFWFEDKGIETQPTTTTIKSTYLDNPFLSAEQIAEIESNKDDANWWRVYGLGETGSVEGLVYTNWDVVDKLPTAPKKEFYCIDFGFTNDPTAILHCMLSGGELYVDEIAYQSGMHNTDIAKALHDAGATRHASIVCDSAEPKSISEINAQGYHAEPATKGQGSITAGISAVQRYKLHVTARSLGMIKELRNYMWKRDINGNYINVPIDKYNHALDALRYGVTKYLWNTSALRRPVPRVSYIR